MRASPSCLATMPLGRQPPSRRSRAGRTRRAAIARCSKAIGSATTGTAQVERVQHRVQPAVADGKRGMAQHGSLRYERMDDWIARQRRRLGLGHPAAMRDQQHQIESLAGLGDLSEQTTRPPCNVPSVA